MQEFLKTISSRLAKRIGLYVILVSTLLSFFTSGFQVYSEYKRERNTVYETLNQIKNAHLANISARVWVLDMDELNRTAKNLLELPAIKYVAIYENNTLLYEAGAKLIDNSEERKYPLIYEANDVKNNIGRLIVRASLDEVYHNIIERAFLIIASNLVKTFIVAIFILFIFYKLVTRHISTISEYLLTENKSLTDKKSLILDRGKRKHDELDLLVNSITDMELRLKEQFAEINEQKQYLSQTLNSIGDAVITTDNEGNIERMNPVAEKLTGWSNDEAHGLSIKNVFSIINATTRKEISNPVEKVLQQGETVHLSNHTTLISKQGMEYQIADSAAPICDDENNILGMVLVFNDVTEQYHLREVAAKSRKDMQAIMDNSPSIIYVKDLAGKLIFINKKFQDLFNVNGNEIINKTLHDIFPKDIADEMKQNDEDVLETGQVLESEEIVMHDNAKHYYYSVKFPLFNDNGTTYAVCSISNDVTKRKRAEKAHIESEERFSQLAENLKEVFWLGSPKWDEVYYVSPAYEKNWGLNAEELYKNSLSWLDAVHPDDKKQVIADIPENVNDIGEYVDFKEYRVVRPDETLLWVKARAYPIKDKKGNIIRIAGIAEDITKRYQAEEALRRTQKMDALGKLTGGIAHDYNNMLGVILGYAELLSDCVPSDTDIKQYVEEISRAGQRGVKLTQKLLAFSRKKITNAERIELNKILETEQHMLEKTLTARIKMVYDLEDNLWPVNIDSGDLEDAILNLCINSMHAIADYGQLTIKTRNLRLNTNDAEDLQVTAGDYVSLSITDTGRGMDESTVEKIFDPFFSTKGEKGTGLGLSQVYGFLERSSGAINVFSELGKGTCITMYFPRYLDEYTSVQETADKNKTDLNGTETILVVDDEFALAKLCEEILSIKGYNVLTAASGKQALEILEKESVDLLLSDVIMPEMDGYELAAVVQKKYPELQIQMISGYSDKHHLKSKDKKLHDNLINKPYRSEVLLERVRELLS